MDSPFIRHGLTAHARDIVARLNRVHGVQPELSGPGHVLCISTIGNSESDMERLVAGFQHTPNLGRPAGSRRGEPVPDAAGRLESRLD